MSHVERLFQNLPAVVTGDNCYFKVNAKCVFWIHDFMLPLLLSSCLVDFIC